MTTSKLVSLVPLLLAGCVVPEARYDHLMTEYHSENQARHELEDEVKRRDGEKADLLQQMSDKDVAYHQLEQDATQSKERVAQLEAALKDAQKNAPTASGDGVEIFRTPDGFAYRLADQLLFESGSTKISESGKKALQTIAKEIKEKNYTNVRIDGHTDSDPVVKTKDKYPRGNQELALERALSVYGVLTNDGKVQESVFSIAGFGPNRPLVKGETEAAKAKNRRVEIHIAVPSKG